MNVHKWFDIPQKLICLLKKNCGLDRHRAARDHWQPFKSREKGSGVSQHLAGWLVTCGWHICIFKDVHRQTQYVWECLCGMWKNPTTSSEEVSSPSQRRYYVFGYFIWRALASAASCKQVAWTGCTENSHYVLCSSVCPATKPKKALQETANQKPLHSNKYDRNSAAHYSSSKTHSLSVYSNEHEQCKQSVHCAAEQETVPLNWG